jgi:hypothetical protein
VGPSAVLDAVVKRKIPIPCRESDLRAQIIQPVAQRYTDRAITREEKEFQHNYTLLVKEKYVVITQNNTQKFSESVEGF